MLAEAGVDAKAYKWLMSNRSFCVALMTPVSEQLDCLRAQGCDSFQGFYLNKPMAAEEFVGLLGAPAPQAVNE